MSDIVDRLRNCCLEGWIVREAEAADEITSLRAALAAAREVIKTMTYRHGSKWMTSYNHGQDVTSLVEPVIIERE